MDSRLLEDPIEESRAESPENIRDLAEVVILEPLSRVFFTEGLIEHPELFTAENSLNLTTSDLRNNPDLQDVPNFAGICDLFDRLKKQEEDAILSQQTHGRPISQEGIISALGAINPYRSNKVLALVTPVKYFFDINNGDFARHFFDEATYVRYFREIKWVKNYMEMRRDSETPVDRDVLERAYKLGHIVYDKMSEFEKQA